MISKEVEEGGSLQKPELTIEFLYMRKLINMWNMIRRYFLLNVWYVSNIKNMSLLFVHRL